MLLFIAAIMLLSLPAVVAVPRLAVAMCLAARYLANSRDKRRMDLFAVGMGIGGAPWRGWASGSLLAKTDSVSWSRAPADWLTLVDKKQNNPKEPRNRADVVLHKQRPTRGVETDADRTKQLQREIVFYSSKTARPTDDVALCCF